MKYPNEILFENTLYKRYIHHIYVNNEGSIASYRNGKMRKLRLDIDKQGYCSVKRKFNGSDKVTCLLVHRMVYDLFGDQPLDPNLVIDHIDNNCSNNHISNLRQITQKENIHHCIEQNRRVINGRKRLSVYDEETNTTKEYSSVREFLDEIEAPNFIKRTGALCRLKDCRKFNRYHVTIIEESN